MLNRVTLIGNLGKDPEVRQTTNSYVAKFSVATSEKKREGQKDETQWHTVKLWGKLAERARNVFKKGDLVHLEGTIKYNQHEGKTYTEIHTFHIARMLKSDQNLVNQASQTAAQEPAAAPGSAMDMLNGLPGIDEIPF